MKTSEANLEFSYDSRNHAEVARESGNIVNIRATVLPNVGRDRRLFLERKQSAAVQLELSFLFEQTQGGADVVKIRKLVMPDRLQ
ncbi:hypothetical protein E2553_12480 [Paraburkholderia dipogonis]|uniref:Uncharacterized protein n=1 Tax=Paraburkholderia dipogonis TaxID=1211383 RepID=A0A4Y8N7L2_9BURK|nr:hypothetical protein [Paraburkholderia dipogonis]TFE45760.1 hypothetical protein E2553_12480 [Paraburkholderia dipogonis]